MEKKKICKLCKNSFIGYHNSKFCTDCKKKARCFNVKSYYKRKNGNSRRIRVCLNCQTKYEINANSQKYCKQCAPIKHKEKRDYYRKINLEILRGKYKETIHKWWVSEKGRNKSKFYRRKRRLKEKQINETFTIEEWNTKITKTKGICPQCKQNVGVEKLALDHIYPISKAEEGRVYTIDDVQPLCKSCNSSKGNKI